MLYFVAATAVICAIQREVGLWAGVLGGALLLAGVLASFLAETPLFVIVIGLAGYGIAVTVLDIMLPVIISAKTTAIAVAFALLFAGPLVLTAHRRTRGAALTVLVAWLVALQYMDWDPRKPYLRAFARIQHGMSVADVNNVFRRQFGGSVPAHDENESGVTYVLDETDGKYNAELIVVTTENGRVVKADYYPD